LGLLQNGDKKYKKGTINWWQMQEHQEADTGGGIAPVIVVSSKQ